jgi:hypothetical protein
MLTAMNRDTVTDRAPATWRANRAHARQFHYLGLAGCGPGLTNPDQNLNAGGFSF